MNRSERSGLQVDENLLSFVEDELLSEVELDAKDFWSTLAHLQERFAPRIADALARRDDVQARIDAWHAEHGVGSRDDYETLLTELGYLAPEPESAPTIDVDRVDPEIAEVPGPQLVVPSTNARFALNAANARWGSLFDAFYGTDALPQDHELDKGYDERRGAQVIEAADDLLDELFPLATGSHRDVTAYRPSTEGLVADTTNHGTVGLADPSRFAGFNADGDTGNVLLVRNGLHVDLVIDPSTQVGRQHHADVSDVVLESAVTTIVDLEDSVATVDGEDKALAYRTWLGLMTGNLVSEFQKGGETVTRRVSPDREYTGADGNPLTLQGRSMMLVRNCGHHMTTNAVLTADGHEVAEGVLDALVSAVAGVYDLQGIGPYTNSRAGSIYIVKPKQHGPEEVALTVELFAAVEEALGLDTNTIKIGIMDEEKRTTLNLAAAIGEAVNRVIFVNTGFLDRTGDEIHTCFAAGPVLRKGDMKSTTWLQTYEDRNVDVALEAGFEHKAQIGKGMWAKPAAMAEMLEQKIGQPKAGANTAWVPSPTAATLHALHYLRTDVHAVQSEIAKRDKADRRKLLELPVDAGVADLSDEDKRYELETNAQSMLGYVVRWVGMGIGCSTVPDLEGTGLMEDRATLRISSQLIANWLEHGVVDEQTVRDTFARMASLVDEQNRGQDGYPPMAPDLDGSESFQAALELVFAGKQEPNGYTERALTTWRQKAKARA
ncbi:malate synthase G [Pseudonocardia endophytica]|uniref:Malate synthase G n=1 Tax=Pseudonocardia endophytica TaxID=401976 RepID=A0A4R1HWR0_PSEEN|nr:malate synthase G [Pseudonocardia endophytica]TCK25505.1 malate synthase [Pseudonocardia endophytica]